MTFINTKILAEEERKKRRNFHRAIHRRVEMVVEHTNHLHDGAMPNWASPKQGSGLMARYAVTLRVVPASSNIAGGVISIYVIALFRPYLAFRSVIVLF